jgi:hypothetical protein
VRNLSEVLCEKEEQLEHLSKEITMLRVAAEILSKETDGTSVYFDFVMGEAEEAVAEDRYGESLRSLNNSLVIGGRI